MRGARGAISVFSAVRTTHAAGARVRADRAPGRPGAGERLVHQVLGRVPIAHADQDGEQALIPGVAVEVREVQSLGSHTISTRSRRTPVTWLAPAPSCRPAHPAEAGQLQRLDRHWLRRFSAGRVRVAGECPGGHGHRLSCPSRLRPPSWRAVSGSGARGAPVAAREGPGQAGLLFRLLAALPLPVFRIMLRVQLPPVRRHSHWCSCRHHGRARRTGREYQPHDLAAGRT